MPILFQVGRTVSRNTNVDGGDTFNIKSVLSALGFYDEPAWGLSPWPDEPMFLGIERFQATNGLRPDGVIKPGGKTERALDDRVRSRQEQLAAERRNTPARRPGNAVRPSAPSSLATAEPFGAGLSLRPPSAAPAAAQEFVANNETAGLIGSEGGHIPDTREQELRRAESYMRDKVREWRRCESACNFDPVLGVIGFQS